RSATVDDRAGRLRLGGNRRKNGRRKAKPLVAIGSRIASRTWRTARGTDGPRFEHGDVQLAFDERSRRAANDHGSARRQSDVASCRFAQEQSFSRKLAGQRSAVPPIVSRD